MRANSLTGRIFAVAGLGLCLAFPALAGPGPAPPELRLPATAEPTGYAVDLRHRSGPADVSRIGRHRGPGQGEDQPPVALRERPHDHEGHGRRRGKDPRRPRGPGRRELRRLRVRQAPFAGRPEAARRVHREGGRELHAGGLSPEGRQRLVRLHAVRDDRRAPRVSLLRRAVLQGEVAADAAHPLGNDGRLEHADRARVVRRGRRARSSASRRPSRCRATSIAFGVGPFEYLDAGTAGAKKTPIRIVTPRGKASQGRYAAQTTGPLLERLEKYFGIPYPYEKLDQLAIPQTVTLLGHGERGPDHVVRARPARAARRGDDPATSVRRPPSTRTRWRTSGSATS